MKTRGGGEFAYVVIWECAIILYTFWVAPGFLGTFLGYSRIFGCHFLAVPRFLGIIFLVKFDFFENNPDFWVLISIFYCYIVECCLQGSCFLFLGPSLSS